MFWLAWILAILAIVFGAVGRAKANQGAPNGGMAVAGLVLGIVGFVFSIVFIVVFVMMADSASDKFQQIADQIANSRWIGSAGVANEGCGVLGRR